ncbi:type-1 angiotensin II receptor B-like [Boleophthalmus pectinirostris]|uniref:type-1 angiotensin II receptor B-like n=1 Tax=Boleophthalmus pectinirostris TaxID=150288 RepID=UPI000A1C683A|nr:type-1 angiotensin II receptor B-like [Boleophthalmus pectinirostris]
MEMLNRTVANSSTTKPPTSVLRRSSDLAPAMLLSLCFLVGFPGNIAVLIFRPTWQQLSRLSQCLMMNLAMSDLLCLVTLPVWIYTLLYSWTLGVATCKIMAFIVHCSLNSSLLTVTALSIQRYMQVIHQKRCLRFKKRLLVLLWAMSMVLSISPLVVRDIKIRIGSDRHMCFPCYNSTNTAQQVAVLFSECFVGFSSFFITAFTYICLNRKMNQAVFLKRSWTSKLITAIIITFFALWMPYFIFDLVVGVAIIQKVSGIHKFFESSYNIFASVTFINSCLNPILYAFALRICGKRNKINSSNHEEPTMTNDVSHVM